MTAEPVCNVAEKHPGARPCLCSKYGITVHLFTPTAAELAQLVGQEVTVHQSGVGSHRGTLLKIEGRWAHLRLADEDRVTQVPVNSTWHNEPKEGP